MCRVVPAAASYTPVSCVPRWHHRPLGLRSAHAVVHSSTRCRGGKSGASATWPRGVGGRSSWFCASARRAVRRAKFPGDALLRRCPGIKQHVTGELRPATALQAGYPHANVSLHQVHRFLSTFPFQCLAPVAHSFTHPSFIPPELGTECLLGSTGA